MAPDIGWLRMADNPRRRIRHPLVHLASLRTRITLAAVLVVGLALVLGSVVLLGLLRANLKDYARTAAEQTADSVAGQLPRASGQELPSLAQMDDDEFVQILGADGTVLASSKNANGAPDLSPPGDGDELTVPFDNHSFVVARKRVMTSQGQRVVISGADLESVNEATASVSHALLGGCPVLLLLVGAITWLAVGRTLRPVDRIRREADGIGATELSRRLPEPARDDEIGRLARTMNRMLARLDQAQRQQRRFVSDAAHELRSPIAAIKQNVEVATDYPESLSTEELLATVLAESTRLERLTTALLSLARLDERSPQRSDHPVDLDDLVFDEVQRLKSTTSLRIDATGVSAGRVGGDEAVLSQVLRNLVDNAERHARTTVALSLIEDGDTVRLSVEDDGPGVPAADRERIFERFVRLDEARTRSDGGSGLGLAIVREVVTAYAGTVVVTEGLLGGARLLVTLPRLTQLA